MATTNISIRMDVALKKEADQLFSEMGMSISTAFNIFVRQAIRERAIPFQIQLGNPNRETITAMLLARTTNGALCHQIFLAVSQTTAGSYSDLF
ncbi:MAG: type II toxin-antitoxin system RelB/DinJ family antitoxin [Varibaculum cambriense]|nr:type II toxin-antitoxin system RelB/DinJ family antitoxin [Varibaculum cambriense]